MCSPAVKTELPPPGFPAHRALSRGANVTGLKVGTERKSWNKRSNLAGGPQRSLRFFPQLSVYSAEEIADGLDHLVSICGHKLRGQCPLEDKGK